MAVSENRATKGTTQGVSAVSVAPEGQSFDSLIGVLDNLISSTSDAIWISRIIRRENDTLKEKLSRFHDESARIAELEYLLKDLPEVSGEKEPPPPDEIETMFVRTVEKLDTVIGWASDAIIGAREMRVEIFDLMAKNAELELESERIPSLEKRLEEMSRTAEELESETLRLEKENKKLKSKNENLESALNEAGESGKKLQNEMKKSSELEANNAELQSKLAELDVIRKELEKNNSEIEKSKKEIETKLNWTTKLL